MSETILHTEIFIDVIENNRPSSGYLIVKSLKTIRIDSIYGNIDLEARGRMSGFTKEISRIKISDQKELLKNETYKIPFTFELHESNLGTYEGRNVSFSYKFTTKINVNETDYEKLEVSFFSNVKSFITSDKSIKASTYFSVKNESKEYQVVEKKAKLKLQLNFMLSVIIAVIVGGLFAYFIPEFNGLYIFAGIAAIALVIFIVYSYLEHTLGKVTMEISKEDEISFICMIFKTRKFSLYNQKAHYEIIEEVIDRRGTSSTTHSEIIYESELKNISEFHKSAKMKFPYPEIKGLQSFKYKDVSIKWKIKLEGTTYFGIRLKYSGEFEVRVY